ncbi:hypothetical protein JCGZ_06893 [Jatropha curcas]|uniref:Uncharacterized protein n=1 Tax=Jatropha curcas TaxID=180498 RepID=A0A067KZW8_JATCU|nr:hypothetical protein JCGZ_06893 [Jatropha curcas]
MGNGTVPIATTVTASPDCCTSRNRKGEREIERSCHEKEVGIGRSSWSPGKTKEGRRRDSLDRDEVAASSVIFALTRNGNGERKTAAGGAGDGRTKR